MGFVARLLATAIAVAAAAWLIPGIEITGTSEAWMAIALFALTLSLVNMIIKPILKVLSLPITILTLGIFYLVLNTLMLYLASWFSANMFGVVFHIESFGSAFMASLVISIVSAIVNAVIGKK